MNQSKLVFIDVETTGLSPQKGHRIIEIGAVAIENNCVIDEFQSLIKINRSIPRHVSKIHGITNEMLTNQPGPENVFPNVRSFIAGSVLIAHNAEFDMAFLRSEFHKLNLTVDNRFLCTLKICRKRYPNLPNHKLDTIYRHLIRTNGDMLQIGGHVTAARRDRNVSPEVRSFGSGRKHEILRPQERGQATGRM
ncbi:MAG: 3'-5' exonuclease [Smithella sp.]